MQKDIKEGVISDPMLKPINIMIQIQKFGPKSEKFYDISGF